MIASASLRAAEPAAASQTRLTDDHTPATVDEGAHVGASRAGPVQLPVIADASDPDGDALTYRWSAPVGAIVNPGDRETLFTCPDNLEAVPPTVTVTDGHGGIASDTILCGVSSQVLSS